MKNYRSTLKHQKVKIKKKQATSWQEQLYVLFFIKNVQRNNGCRFEFLGDGWGPVLLLQYSQYACFNDEDGVVQLVEHWTANLVARVRSPVGGGTFRPHMCISLCPDGVELGLADPRWGRNLPTSCVHFSMSKWSRIGLGCQCVTVGTLASDVAL